MFLADLIQRSYKAKDNKLNILGTFLTWIKNNSNNFAITCSHIYTFSACKKPADVAVLLDASGSIGRRKWPLVAGFTKSLVNSFGISEEGSHIAVVMYATKTKVVVGFNDFVGADRTPANINAKIDAIDYNDWKGMTYIDRGLDTANKFVFTEAAGMRPDKKKVRCSIYDCVPTFR